ncbi:MAG: VWA domain-containing protein, partial [Proteobacteria bacterium]|nr:VWA domain-containing protein [Pseudomonadota bacterium]
MLINFFMALKQEGLPVSFTELFTLLECLKQNVIFGNVDDFYYLSRLCMVKDEKNFDKFDVAFAKYFENVEVLDDLFLHQIPDEWLRKQLESMLSDDEKARIEALGGLEKLMEEFRKRMAEQQKRHQGGSKWIGTGGTSPFGAYGDNPEGIRLGQQEGR